MENNEKKKPATTAEAIQKMLKKIRDTYTKPDSLFCPESKMKNLNLKNS
jgi:hypothetical protein